MTRGVGAAQPVGVVGAEYGKCMSWRGVAALAIVDSEICICTYLYPVAGSATF